MRVYFEGKEGNANLGPAVGSRLQTDKPSSSKGIALCLSNEAYGAARLPEIVNQWAKDGTDDADGFGRVKHRDVAIKRVCIPMANGVDSLNVATAGAILMHQIGDARLLWE